VSKPNLRNLEGSVVRNKQVLFASGAFALAAAMSTGSAQAQTASSDVPAPQEVVVTGSRIARPNLDQPTPISTLSSIQIENAGTANLGDIIATLPEVGTGATVRANSNNYGNGAGLSEIDLHNLGTSRTLVLVDGQRHVGGDISNDAVDVNSIPAALVDHVEVITGGASAVYGSDAVSGVVNIILKKDFEGVQAEVQDGGYSGYGNKWHVNATLGHNFLDGRANLTFSGFYNYEQGINAANIPNDHNYGTITNPNDLSGPLDPTFYSSPAPKVNDGIPDTLLVPNVGSEFIARNGVLLNPATGLPITGFTATGQPVQQPARTGYNSYAFGQLPASCVDCYFGESYTQIESPLQTRGFELTGHLDFTPHLRGTLDAKFVDTSGTDTIQPDFSFGNYGIAPDNAFITPAIASVLAPVYAAAPGLAATYGGTASNYYPLYSAFLNDNRLDQFERRTYRIVAGLSGDVDIKLADIKWDTAVNYGQTASHFDINNIQIVNNFQAALDSVINPATGLPACRVNVPSAQPAGYVPPALANPAACVPFDPFGSQQSAASEAYSFGRFLTRDYLTQQDYNFNFNFDSSRIYKLPGGPVGFAFGAEYRMERTYELNDQALLDGSTDNLASNSAGGFNVSEGYGEVNVPVFKHAGLGLDELSFDGALRYGYYSTVHSVDANKISVVYGPINWLKFRGTYSSAVRAPNITEAFSPQQQTYFNITDPCSANNITSNVNYAKNCAAAGVPVGFQADTNASIVGQTSGNPSLKPEKSLSYTGGFLVQPPMIPHLDITVDYYSILIRDAITQVAAQDIIDNCYNAAAGLDETYCKLFTRSPTTGNINFVETTYVNSAELYTSGIELQTNYTVGVSPLTSLWQYSRWMTGRFSAGLDINYVLKLRDYPFANNLSDVNIWEGAISATEGSVPQMRALLNLGYKQGPVTVDWTVRYLSHTARFSLNPGQADYSESIDPPYANSRFIHNVVVRYDLGGDLKGTELYAGVNDLFGELPPLGLVQGSNADAGYDLGRYIFAGVKFRR